MYEELGKRYSHFKPNVFAVVSQILNILPSLLSQSKNINDLVGTPMVTLPSILISLIGLKNTA